MRAASFEKYIALVEKKNSVPFGYHLEDVGEFGLDLVGIDAQITSRHHEQWSAHVLGHGLSGKSLKIVNILIRYTLTRKQI